MKLFIGFVSISVIAFLTWGFKGNTDFINEKDPTVTSSMIGNSNTTTTSISKSVQSLSVDVSHFVELEAEQVRAVAEAEREAERKAHEAEHARQRAAQRAAQQTSRSPAKDVWYRLFGCETGQTYNAAINTGNGYYGAFQFDLQTWRSVGGSGYPHQHSYETQKQFAMKLHSLRGWSPWPKCSRQLGLR